jgi:exodeoxyribonuclease V alpha subunit
MLKGSLASVFSRRVQAWSQRSGASLESQRRVADAAYRVAEALFLGHTCLKLNQDDVSSFSNDGLLESGVVGRESRTDSYPLILDDANRLYLHRYFDYEQRLAQRLVQASLHLEASEHDDNLKKILQSFFPPSPTKDSDTVDWQKCAAALALIKRFVVVSGGPGTGKTTMVVNLLACLITQNYATRIVLAAPTGKAATRMLEALRKRAQNLPEAIRAVLPDTATTVHRLLGFNPRHSGFAHDAAHPLSLDVLVVDEASMLDLSLATHLLEAVPKHARVILLGDKDQLAAVESGAVFAELSSQNGLSPATSDRLAGILDISPTRLEHLSVQSGKNNLLQDSVVWFTQQHRFSEESAIGRVAHLIREGDEMGVMAMLKAPSCCELGLQWRIPSIRSQRPSAEEMERLYEGFKAFWSLVRGASYQDADLLLQAFDGFRVLCATRRGPWGSEQLSISIEAQARNILLPPEEKGFETAWYVGRPVMIVRNDPQLKLFNGDIGITLVGPEGELQVCFPSLEDKQRRYAPARLPQYESAYAMTIHKSQGSELDHVAVVFPTTLSPVLTRELLYTGITRARQSVLIISSEQSLRQAIQTPSQRSSGLLGRLTKALASKGLN